MKGQKKSSLPSVIVVGHQNPDTDACVSAYVAARLKSRLDSSRKYSPVIQGEPNAQTAWLFEEVGAVLPPVLTDVRYQVGELMCSSLLKLHISDSLAQAINILQGKQISVVPIVDDEGRLQGVISDRLPQNKYLFGFNCEDYLGQIVFMEDVSRCLKLKKLNNLPQSQAHGSFRLAIQSATSLGDKLHRGMFSSAGKILRLCRLQMKTVRQR